MGRGMKKNIRIALLVLWIAIIFVLTGYPGLGTPHINEFPIDKIYHVILFFILGIIEHKTVKTVIFFVLGVTIILIAEFQQLAIPSRAFEIWDIVAGVIGLCIAYVVFNGRNMIRNALSKT
jgi:VanZ family protein